MRFRGALHSILAMTMAITFGMRPASAETMPTAIQVPEGFTVEVVAAPPLVTHPMFATFDDRGRLFVCENAGVNMTFEELEEKLPNSIRLLEDTDNDGRFDKSTVFADKMNFPMGGAWHQGALYVASPPYIWRLADNDGDGVADQRDKLVGKFGDIGNAAGIHGCVSGPDGRIYWCDGYHGHEFRDSEGKITSKREGAYLFSCRPDGSDTRIHCGGGMDNPVEIDFTREGEMLGTVNILYTRPRVDCFVHWLYGGVYPHREQVLAESKRTGDMLGPVHRFGHVAVSGTLRYRSGSLDPTWRDDFFATFFNSGKVVRLELERDGATFRATQREFLSSSDRDFHPTDIVEDADGSLLVLNTGGWFYRGCPTSQHAKPEILGAIYRIRSRDMPAQEDVWGKEIDWSKLAPEQLVALFVDRRCKVRAGALAECARRGDAIVPTLQETLASDDAGQRNSAVWALGRIIGNQFTPPSQVGANSARDLSGQVDSAARSALRSALVDRDRTVRLAAAQVVATYPDPRAFETLVELLDKDDAPTRRTAAAALGRLGDRRAVPALLSALGGLGKGVAIDRAEEHAIIYALIELDDPAQTRQGLAAIDDDVRRGALVALDQMDHGDLQATDLLPLLAARDLALQQRAAEVFSRHGEWSPQAATVIDALLNGEESAIRNAGAIRKLLKTFLSDSAVREVVGKYLRQSQSARQELLLAAIAEGGAGALHDSWLEPLTKALRSDDPELIERAIGAVAATSVEPFRERLVEIGADQHLPALLRVAAIQASAGQTSGLPDEAFQLLIDLIAEGEGGERVQAAQKLGNSALSDSQLVALAELLPQATSAQLRELVRPFERSDDAVVAQAFLGAMENAENLTILAPHEFSDVILGYPPELLARANQLLDRVRQAEQEKLLRLDRLIPLLDHGDAERGRALFFSEKSTCATCHAVGGMGGKIGPDLTTIGANRAPHDLLESIVFPSATLVRDYEPYTLITVDGRVLSGLIARQTSDTVYLQQQTGDPVAIPRSEIDELTASSVSIMPNGMEKALTETELADVVAYLLSLRQPVEGGPAGAGQ